MADAHQHQTRHWAVNKRAVKKKRKAKHKTHAAERFRVNIGLACTRWRQLKADLGLRSDSEVALHLLDVMKSSSSASSGGTDTKLKFSQTEVQRLIRHEVHREIRTSETTVQGLIESIRHHGDDCESCIKKLEVRINTVNERAKAALAYMKRQRRKHKLPSVSPANISGSDSEEENVEVTPENKRSRPVKDKEFFQVEETTQKTLKELLENDTALMAAMEDLSETPPALVLTAHGSRDCEAIKEEPENGEGKENGVEASTQFEETAAVRMKEELRSPGRSSTHTPSEQEKPLYPPLPPITFPSVLSMEAVSFSIPQKVKLFIALIRKPPSLSLLWNVLEEDPSAPPMDSYRVIMTMEMVKGSGIFSKWKTVGEIKAIPLPICVMVSKYKPGHVVAVAVVGKDKFGRYGPYSDVATAAIPEEIGPPTGTGD